MVTSKSAVSQSVQKALNRFCLIVLLTGVVSTGVGFVGLGEVIALTPLQSFPTVPVIVSSTGEGETTLANQPTTATALPPSLSNKVRQDLSKRTGLPPGKLRVVESSRKSWPNGCLGIEKPDEFCTMAMVEGWRVVLSDGKRRWVYRTDRQGRVLRMEPPTQSSPVR